MMRGHSSVVRSRRPRWLHAGERAVTLVEVLVAAAILATVVLAILLSNPNVNGAANAAALQTSWQTIMMRTRAEAANAGALLNVTSGTTVTLYSGWSTGTTPVASWVLPAPIGFNDAATPATADAFVVYVRRNGSWYLTSGSYTSTCSASVQFGAWTGSAVDGLTAHVVPCASFALAPGEEQ